MTSNPVDWSGTAAHAAFVLRHSSARHAAGPGHGAPIKVIGHRGAAGHAPENTNAAFDWGLQFGVDGVETDIRATRDGVLVLMHDATVDRTTDGSGNVADLTWEQVGRLDAAARFRGGDHGFGVQRVPRLEDFLDRYGGRTTFRLEIKAPGVEDGVVRAVRARRLTESVVFTSFQLPSLTAIRLTAPEAQLAYLSGAPAFDQTVVEAALRVGANEVAPRAGLATAEMVAAAQQAGLRVWAWGVKDQETLRAAAAAGIGGCTLDYPDWAVGLAPAR